MDPLTIVGLVAALGLALSFEFVNGFHDTANAVATVIYTRTLPATAAVVWSGCWNLVGVLLSSGAVAFGIVALLPVELVIHVGSAAGFAMVFAMLVSAIIWNLGTWYLGLPASSSHTLIGSIVGVGIANSLLAPGHVFGDGVNWGKVQDTFTALIVSPIVGFVLSGLLLLAMKALIHYKPLYEPPPDDKSPPPWPVRALLVLTCTGVSFAHGSNDGQKGMGLIMLILIGVLPGAYALDQNISGAKLQAIATSSHQVAGILAKESNVIAPPTADAARPLQLASTNVQVALDTANVLPGKHTVGSDEQILSDYIKSGGKLTNETMIALSDKNNLVSSGLDGKTTLASMTPTERKDLRTNIYLVSASIDKLVKSKKIADADEIKSLTTYRKGLDSLTKFIPTWVKIAVAFALGLGTMIGWKRIVVTVGEKIGKTHLTYGQGAAAEMVAYATIQAADIYGLPVSTTHVLSSGVAGTMAANGSGLQQKTMRDILLAWVLTLPACVILGSVLFSAAIFAITRMGIQ
jgi:PiT family inorganic phosphate transporter